MWLAAMVHLGEGRTRQFMRLEEFVELVIILGQGTGGFPGTTVLLSETPRQ